MSYYFSIELRAAEQMEQAARDLTDAQFDRIVAWIRAHRKDAADAAEIAPASIKAIA